MALINVSMLLMTNVKAKIKIAIANITPPLDNNNEKIIVLGSFAWSNDTATIPQKQEAK